MTPAACRAPATWVLRVLLALPVIASAAEPAMVPLRFGFSSRVVNEYNETDLRAALKVWAQTLSLEKAIPLDPDLRIYRGLPALRDALRQSEVDALSLSPLEFWALRKAYAFGPQVLLSSMQGKTTEEYLLLVRRDSPAARLADLRGRTVLVVGGARADMAEMWLETLLLDQHLGPSRSFWEKFAFSLHPSQVVLPVFFGQIDACVITRAGFQTMCELNPQVGQRLRVLAESPSLVPTLLCFRADMPSPARDRLIASANRVKDSVPGRQILVYFQAEQVVARPVSDLDADCALLDRHQHLLEEADPAAERSVPAGGAP